VKPRHSSTRLKRGNPFLRERVHDPLQTHGSRKRSARCPDCGAQFRNGRWEGPQAPAVGLKPERCPACLRIEEDYPAGELVLSGGFLQAHRDEILATVKHVEERERGDHPLNRIMAIDEHEGAIVISTTDVHLPHRIAHALRNAWDGATKTHYDPAGYFTRVQWVRED
jgi:NMD protein affecting ribosome stability and mRNA decay